MPIKCASEKIRRTRAVQLRSTPMRRNRVDERQVKGARLSTQGITQESDVDLKFFILPGICYFNMLNRCAVSVLQKNRDAHSLFSFAIWKGGNQFVLKLPLCSCNCNHAIKSINDPHCTNTHQKERKKEKTSLFPYFLFCFICTFVFVQL